MLELFRKNIGKPYILFPIISLIFGLIFVNITPPLWGFDEPAHFARSYQIVQGQILPDASHDSYGGTMPKNYADLHWYKGADMIDGRFQSGSSVLQRQDVTDESAYKKLLEQLFSHDESRFPWTAMYSPVSYPGPIVAIYFSKIFSLTIGQTLFLARFFSLIIYVLLASIAIYLLRRQKNLVWLFFIVLLLPTCISQAATVNADNVLMPLITLFFALYVLIRNKEVIKRKYKIGILICIAILLPLIKINFIIISLLAVLQPSMYFVSKRAKVVFMLMASMIIVIPGVIWSRVSGSTATPPQSQRQDLLMVNPGEQIVHIAMVPMDFVIALIKSWIVYGNDTVEGTFFTLSGMGVQMPILLVFLVITTIIVLGINAKKDIWIIRRDVIVAGGAALFTVLSTYFAIYAVFNPVGWWFIDGVQGRYFTPLIIPLVLFVATLLPYRINLRKNTATYLSISVALITLVIATTYDYLALY